uniref:Putative solute carrier family 39 (zinc transporter) n=1 Tax=Schistosoma mansoni TaxID=6183 RepID=A0A5K4EUQ4_SCHMA
MLTSQTNNIVGYLPFLGDIDAFQIPGLWILGGLLLFFIIEKLCIHDSAEKEVEGYLNLAANVIDNFTHGVAIAGSYLVSLRLGILTTTCILVHEVPHEMADFVILLRSGFSRWEAAKAQLQHLDPLWAPS